MSQKPRVLCFGRFFDETPGGIQRHVEYLFQGMQGRAEMVHLVPSRDWSRAKLSLHGFPVWRTRSVSIDGSVALSPELVWEAWRQNRRQRFDLIHLHFPDPMTHLASMVLPRGIPRVITWHADIVRQKRLLAVYRPFLQQALDRSAAIITSTPAHVTSSPFLSNPALAPKIHIVPYGFDLSRFTTPRAGAGELRRRFGGRFIFALGRHVSYKGFDVLIRAMKQVSAPTPLVLGGVGPLTEELKVLAAAERLADRVHFVGMIDEAELPAYFQACELFCLPSVTAAEAFGIVQVEAMAAGKPVVSTRLGTGVDVVNRDGETGYTVAPSDAGALAAALNRLLEDPQAAMRMGQRAQEWSLGEYGLDAMADRTLAIYQSAIAGSKRNA